MKVKVDQEVFNQAKRLINTKLFSYKQIGEMLNVSSSSISQISRYGSLEEMRAGMRASLELSMKRKLDRSNKEQEAKALYEKALEEEKAKSNPALDMDHNDSPEVKLDIISEKLDTIIGLLKEVVIAGNKQTTQEQEDFFGTKPF